MTPPPTLTLCQTTVVSLTPTRTVVSLTPTRTVVAVCP